MNNRTACEIICFASFFSVVSVSRLFETFDYGRNQKFVRRFKGLTICQIF